ncbi:hypothetical protein HH212_20155 [Massilia forsythiae]|uniref:Uncharacterized protein n=1 Tax=Massilia forsythiae TaxID=2728020 RepID=A0A7Z2VZ15_9BURK|nr:hypothetical protein [Massilia forsythiae]QJE02048.1 hypothetical protein HH212_20155 [Massilia forsythiae]
MTRIALCVMLAAAATMAPAAYADTSPDFVRIACVPEAGLLDVEYRRLHDSMASDPAGPDGRRAVLAAAGFHDPHDLRVSCTLGTATYTVTAQQDPASNLLCGGVPEIHLSLARNGERVLSDVVFGDSCRRLPSVTGITVGDGPAAWRGRETRVCYRDGEEDGTPACDWTSGGQPAFDRRFPVDQARLRAIVGGRERR